MFSLAGKSLADISLPLHTLNMENMITLYHGSDHIVHIPEYGFEKGYKDYGQGFYCTMDMELAKEWSVTSADSDGFVNIYSLDISDLDVLDLSRENILTWIAILVNNRKFEIRGVLAASALTYLNDNFLIDYEKYDVITGWRADDSYFAYAGDFLNGAVFVQRLKKAMQLGNLGIQYVLKSRKAFERISFIEAVKTPAQIYFEKRVKRDTAARNGYLYGERFEFDKDDLFIGDIMRQEVSYNDPRIW